MAAPVDQVDNERVICVEDNEANAALIEGVLAVGQDGESYQVVMEEGEDAEGTEWNVCMDNNEQEDQEDNTIELNEGTELVAVEEVTFKREIAIQANDFEIEPRSGRLPARQRFIPSKFRDFQDPDFIVKEDPDDQDYKPSESKSLVKKVNLLRSGRSKAKRGRGRPRKFPAVEHNYGSNSAAEAMTVEQEAFKAKEQETMNAANAVLHRYECNHGECKDVRFKSYYLYKKHIQALHKGESLLRGKGRPPRGSEGNPRLFSCLICNKSFTQKGNLKVHMGLHSGVKPYRCNRPDCKHAFRTNEALEKHLQAHDGVRPSYRCEECDKNFSSKVALKEHSTRHTGEHPYQCEVCPKKFRQLSCYYRHLLLHKGEKKYKCEVCAKGFTQGNYLKVHMRSHTGEKPYHCRICPKRFAYQSDLTRHQNVHNGVKKYLCETCGARFSDPSSKRRHMKDHTGVKPYTCQLCSEAFKRAGQLKAHLAKRHLNNEDVIVSRTGKYNALQFFFRPEGEDSYMPLTDEQGNVMGGEGVPPTEPPTQQQQATVQIITQGQPHTTTQKAVIGAEKELTAETQDIIRQIHAQLGKTPSNQPVAYNIIHDDENHQIVEVQYPPNQDSAPQTTSVPGQKDPKTMLITSKSPLSTATTTKGMSFVRLKAPENQMNIQGAVQNQSQTLMISPRRGQLLQSLQPNNVLSLQSNQIAGQSLQPHTTLSLQPNQIAGQSLQPHTILSLQPNNQMQPQSKQSNQVVVEFEQQQGNVDVNDTVQFEQQGNVEGVDDAVQVVDALSVYSEDVIVQEIEDEEARTQEILIDNDTMHIEHLGMVEISDSAVENSGEIPSSSNRQIQQGQGQEVMMNSELGQGDTVIEGQTVVMQQPPQSEVDVNIHNQGDNNVNVNQGQIHALFDSQSQDSGAYVETNTEFKQQDEEVNTWEEHIEPEINNEQEEYMEEETLGESGTGTELEEDVGNDFSALDSDFIHKPDFDCQEYYDWLNRFTDQCKMLAFPLDKVTFGNISFVHKTLADVLATPSGVLSNKNNFLVLKTFSEDLYAIVNEHLTVVMESLEGE